MMIINMSYMGKEPSFSLIPITENAPFVECIFMPQEKQLAVISKVVKDTFPFFPRLDDNGDPIPARRRVESRSPFKEERKQIKTYYEYYITDINDIKEFIDIIAVNNTSKILSTFLV